MNPFGNHLLNVITYLPMVGALIILVAMRESSKRRSPASPSAIAGLDLLLALPLWFGWHAAAPDAFGFRFVHEANWIEAIGVKYVVGVDGISMLLVLLTTLLGFIAVPVARGPGSPSRVKQYYAFMLLLQTGMLGVFVSLDFFLFYIFWEVMLVPMYFIIGVWGGKRRLYAAVKFFIYTLLGSVLMLLGILALYFHHGSVTGDYTFDIRVLQAMGQWPDWFATAVLGLAGVLRRVCDQGADVPVPHLAARRARRGAHRGIGDPGRGAAQDGHLRVPALQPADHARRHASYFLPWALGLAVVGVIYGAMVALVQKDWKKLVAYSSVSHLGFTMVGIFALNAQGLTGGVLQMINHGLSTGALFLLVGLVYERRHTREIAEYGGLWRVMPVFAVFFMVMMLSSIGMPAIPGQRIRRRVRDSRRAPSAWPTSTGPCSPRPASCSARSTCCGCTSARCSASSTRKRTSR